MVLLLSPVERRGPLRGAVGGVQHHVSVARDRDELARAHQAAVGGHLDQRALEKGNKFIVFIFRYRYKETEPQIYSEA